MTVIEISRLLKKALKPYGLIDWHTSSHGSQYFKFRDTRIGSIRIADHGKRQKYSYTWDIDSCLITPDALDTIYNEILAKIITIRNFDPKVYLVYSKQHQAFIEAPDFDTYSKYILRTLT